MWIWVTVLGLLVELLVIVVLGRSATRGSEQDEPPPARPDRPLSAAGHRAGRAAR